VLEEGYRRLCCMLPAFSSCLASTFMQVLARTAGSWARRASECWTNQKVVVLFPRSDEASMVTACIGNLEPAHVPGPSGSIPAEGAACFDDDSGHDRRHLHRDAAASPPHAPAPEQAGGAGDSRDGTEHGPWDFDRNGPESDIRVCGSGSLFSPFGGTAAAVEPPCRSLHAAARTTSAGSGTRSATAPSRTSRAAGDARIQAVDAGGRRRPAPEPEPEDAAVLRLLEYMRGMAAAARDGPGVAGDMDAVVESLAGRGGAVEEVEAWARSRSC
jgi:hypothetical protein